MRGAERFGAHPSVAAQIESWIADYRPIPGVPDEFIDESGRARAHWVRYFVALAKNAPQEIAQRFETADRQIRDSGVSYRAYGEQNERTWPLGRLPLLIDSADWKTIAAGVAQRAEIWDRALADIYGEGRLVSEGVAPAAAILGSRDFLRPLHGVKPAGGRWLRFYAADIGRGPDGRWWIIGDRGQAPSGAGYALENRLVYTRAFSNLYRDLSVERLAGFFRAFRDGMIAEARRAEPRICLMTPGPFTATYFEQAYLARYLGFLLVEGGDLVMRDGNVHVRTIAGLKRADVLWRQVDAQWCDPLELNSASQLGVPGLIEAVRDGGVVMTNMPGAGLIESRALLGYLPAIARRLTGQELQLPHIATWWCGDPRAANHVLDNFDTLAIAGAFGDEGAGIDHPTPAAEISSARKDELRAAIARRGVDYVGQEVVQLSTTPVWRDGALEPRPFVLRVFAAATPQGWMVMPGGFSRISDNMDARALSMGEGVSSSDVWVLSDKPVEMTSLLPRAENVRIVRQLGNLPSRAADNLFWFGRYLERTEATLRLVRCFCARSIDVDRGHKEAADARARLQFLLSPRGANAERSPSEVASQALHNPGAVGSGLALARAARRAASIIRERLSPDIWLILNDLEQKLAQPLSAYVNEAELIERAEEALERTAALSGLVQENFNRVAGWNFLDMGRRVERGVATCGFAREFSARDASAESLDVLLDLIDSQISYRSRYIAGLGVAPVRDMALLDPNNPRSVAFQAARMVEHLTALPSLRADGVMEAPLRIARKLDTEIATSEADKLDLQKISGFEQKFMRLAEAIEARYFLQGASAQRAETMKGLA
ncbi:MAG: circularly permuted type 2 ATP-grasp protein [Hyphomicrobiales bacterium]|nr:circularly permuted type 2 ATP-grasp protein [Hyphomicrobiales bacterium]